MATTVVVLHHVSWHGLYFMASLFVGAGTRPQLELKINYALFQLRIISTTEKIRFTFFQKRLSTFIGIIAGPCGKSRVFDSFK